MSKFQSSNESPNNCYTINNFLNELKSVKSVENSFNEGQNKSNNINQANSFLRKNYYDLKNQYNDDNSDESLKFKIVNIKSENDELKFCLNSIIKIIDKKFLKYSKIANINEQNIKNIKKETNNKTSLIQSLNEKIINLEKTLQILKENKDDLIEDELNFKNNENNNINIIKENNLLKKEIDEKENKIKKSKNELETRNELFIEINNLKKEMINHKQTIDRLNNDIVKKNEIISNLKTKLNSIDNNSIEKDIEQLKMELKENNKNNELLNDDIEKIKNSIILETSNKLKMEEILKKTNDIIKETNDTQKQMKEDYDNTINSLINKFENEISTNIKIKKKKDLEEENNKLKNINKELNAKIKEIYELNNNYNKLLQNINAIKEENRRLRNKNQIKMNNNNNYNISTFKTNRNVSLSDNDIKDINLTLPNHIMNNNSFYDIPNNNLINNTSVTINNEFKTSPIVFDDYIYKKNFPFNKMQKDKESINNKIESKYLNKNDNDNKLPSLTSLIISNENRKLINYNEEGNINYKNNETNVTGLKGGTINQNFNLYKPIQEGLLVFNLANKIFSIIVPEKYNEFWQEYQVEGSLQYNTLEGLFIINAKNNQLYYYSSKKNIFCDLLTFKENHSYGCLFLDNLSKNIIAIGGKYSKSVELFVFESSKIEDLPDLSTHRSKTTCCQVNNKIYCLFGISEERPDESLIEYLDLDDLKNGWVEVNYINQASFKLLTCMSCVNLNDAELLIIGGKLEDKNSNEKLVYYNVQSKELCELDKDLPESENRNYLFTQNIMFNLFLNGKIISFINIDDYNQVHIIDNELRYDLYLSPNL